MDRSTYRFSVELSKNVAREDFYDHLQGVFQAHAGFLGLNEGFVSVADRDGEESFDSGVAPLDRDWVGDQEVQSIDLYFENSGSASEGRRKLSHLFPYLKITEVEEEKPRDWNAEWKRSFVGVKVAPFWKVIPPWKTEDADEKGDVRLVVNPGSGFGTGTHETTQLCLEAIGMWHQARNSAGKKVLDFGSGSGILSIAAAILGCAVEAVEIDPLAIENAEENAALNTMQTQVRFLNTLESLQHRSYDLVIANILRPVLLEFSKDLVRLKEKRGSLILSGLLESDIVEVRDRYSALMGVEEVTVLQKNDWRALWWK